jgi:hypothetical protein
MPHILRRQLQDMKQEQSNLLVYNYFIWSMIQRGSGTSFTNLWGLLLSIQSLLHYIENSQENKKNTILS